MITLLEIQEAAQSALDTNRLSERGWTFQWDMNSKRRAGVCKYDERVIALSFDIFSRECNRHGAYDVILHEVAHALVGHDAGHGPIWETIALALGCSASRCHTLMVDLAWKGSCECGPDTHQRERKVRDGVKHRCNACHGVVTWHKNDTV